MRKQSNIRRVMCTALFAVALLTLAFAGSASAKLTGEFTKFQQCPWTNAEVNKCLYSVTKGGEVVLGSKKVPIVNPVTLQGGFGKPVSGFSKFFAATNGVTLSKTPQPVPGGLAGFVNCKEISNIILRFSCEGIFENGLTGVNSTLELARPASEISISEIHLAEEEEVALKMPVKFHLENPLFGDSCFVGSSSSPIWWELTTGFTNPPPPNKQIRGDGGTIKLTEEGRILNIEEAVLVENAWAAPSASGCGGIFSFIINPIVNASSGLPAAAGKNTAILKNAITVATAAGVKKNDEDNP